MDTGIHYSIGHEFLGRLGCRAPFCIVSFCFAYINFLACFLCICFLLDVARKLLAPCVDVCTLNPKP
jgi:hypothetical protein